MKIEQLKKVSLIIKTFERPKSLHNLLRSIDKYYGKYGESLQIFIADDSRIPLKPKFNSRNRVYFFPLPFDSGLSKGRNFLVDKIDTDYFVTLDDDFIFTKKTKIEDFVDTMEKNSSFDILGGSVFNYRKHWWKKKKKIDGNRSVKIENGILKRYKKPVKVINNYKIYNFIINFFIAKTSKVKELKWNEKLKIVEHTAFFLDCMKNHFIIAVHPSVRINHRIERNKFYKQFRVDRVDNFVKYLHENYNFTKDIEEN